MIAFAHTVGALVITDAGRRVFHRFPSAAEDTARRRHQLAVELSAWGLFAEAGPVFVTKTGRGARAFRRLVPASPPAEQPGCASSRSAGRSDSERRPVSADQPAGRGQGLPPLPAVDRLAIIHGDAAAFDRGLDIPL